MILKISGYPYLTVCLLNYGSLVFLFCSRSIDFVSELLLFTTVVNPTPNQTFFSRTVENILNDFFSEDDAVVAVTNRASHPNGTLTE